MDTSASSVPPPDESSAPRESGNGVPGPEGRFPLPTGERLAALGPNPTDAQLAGFHAPGRPDIPSEFWERVWLVGRQVQN
jgi:hypothetical protein